MISDRGEDFFGGISPTVVASLDFTILCPPLLRLLVARLSFPCWAYMHRLNPMMAIYPILILSKWDFDVLSSFQGLLLCQLWYSLTIDLALTQNLLCHLSSWHPLNYTYIDSIDSHKYIVILFQCTWYTHGRPNSSHKISQIWNFMSPEIREINTSRKTLTFPSFVTSTIGRWLYEAICFSLRPGLGSSVHGDSVTTSQRLPAIQSWAAHGNVFTPALEELMTLGARECHKGQASSARERLVGLMLI